MEAETAQTEEVAPAENALNADFWFELSEPRWSVVTFESCAAKNLTYEEALQKMEELKQKMFQGFAL